MGAHETSLIIVSKTLGTLEKGQEVLKAWRDSSSKGDLSTLG